MSGPLKRLRIPNPLLRQELPWLVAEVVLLVILFNANPPELWFWLVVVAAGLSAGHSPCFSLATRAIAARCSPGCAASG
ncbi:MAG: hypothetical protein ACKOPS_17135 [Cyanobium sp.]